MSDNHSADGRAGIDAALVARLVAAQFPQWSDLPVAPVEVDGWDNRTYRLGDDLTVRLPTGETYALAVEKEHRWLPMLAERLPLEIPEPLGLGHPGEGYPHPWAIRRWIDGEIADPSAIEDMPAFAEALAGFITALQAIDPTGGPVGGEHSFHRGTDPAHYDDQTCGALQALEGRVDIAGATAVWEAALTAPGHGRPVWFHGDIARRNLLTRTGKLAAVIDFGTCGVGDPACDLVIAWTLFEGESREVFRRGVEQDEATWARARGWAIWKALISLTWDAPDDLREAPEHHRVIEAVITELQKRG
jgi:aminoglycoside phosphotransferase (APT) family kinase protein